MGHILERRKRSSPMAGWPQAKGNKTLGGWACQSQVKKRSRGIDTEKRREKRTTSETERTRGGCWKNLCQRRRAGGNGDTRIHHRAPSKKLPLLALRVLHDPNEASARVRRLVGPKVAQFCHCQQRFLLGYLVVFDVIRSEDGVLGFSEIVAVFPSFTVFFIDFWRAFTGCYRFHQRSYLDFLERV